MMGVLLALKKSSSNFSTCMLLRAKAKKLGLGSSFLLNYIKGTLRTDKVIALGVNNRDMSIAVLRAFISKRKQEHEAMLSKRARSSGKVPEKDASFRWCFPFPPFEVRELCFHCN
ncbi:hypothetical protein DY000_02017852 [Brassica cretica]|uniref:Uncharacterized protein n=1 Tax=Brassica cretica TaxID=69181 RepID=A0ABQ7DEP7_BRACR|nr:hypothetical protein DY000_02017852 [Brassica cretica]